MLFDNTKITVDSEMNSIKNIFKKITTLSKSFTLNLIPHHLVYSVIFNLCNNAKCAYVINIVGALMIIPNSLSLPL